MRCILTVDVGTSSLKGIVYNLEGKPVYSSSREYSSVFKKGSYIEQDPKTWKESLIAVLQDICGYINQNSIDVCALSVTSQRASVIPVDKDGEPLFNAIMWQDKRTIKQCRKILNLIGEDFIYKKTGLKIDPYFSTPKMLWLKEELPDIFNKAYKLIGVQDYVIYLLTGRFVTDWSQASRVMLMDINRFEWDNELLNQLRIDKSILPDLCAPGSIVGGLTSRISELTGLKEGIPVVISGGDQQCAALALNVLKPGYAEANTGTGSFVIAFSEGPAFDEKRRTLCSASAVPGKWIVEAGIFTTGAVYRWFNKKFYLNNSEQSSYEAIDREAQKAPVGSNGIQILPHFEGSAAPYWNPLSKGLIFNITLGTDRSDISRAILEGIAFEIADNLDLIESLSGDIKYVSVAGGITRFKLFNQIQADAFNRSVIKYENSEASSLGAFISACVTLGVYESYSDAFTNTVSEDPSVYEPDSKNVSIYKEMIKRKNLLYNALNEKGIYELFGRDTV